jgi:hypothetical protein
MDAFKLTLACDLKPHEIQRGICPRPCHDLHLLSWCLWPDTPLLDSVPFRVTEFRMCLLALASATKEATTSTADLDLNLRCARHDGESSQLAGRIPVAAKELAAASLVKGFTTTKSFALSDLSQCRQ